nr:EAL domain-containing protein [Williamsia marianensis]
MGVRHREGGRHAHRATQHGSVPVARRPRQGPHSIYYLDRYPVFECFKIDKSFIADLPGARPEAIVSAIVGLARAFDVTVVGEGVETAEQLEALRACGADYAQGYHLGRPAAADDVTATLRSAIV